MLNIKETATLYIETKANAESVIATEKADNEQWKIRLKKDRAYPQSSCVKCRKMNEDKLKGVFFGQAIGDALGLGTEFMTQTEVRKYYPHGLNDYSQIIQDYHRSRWEKGSWTDDTDMMLCIAESIVKNKGVNLPDIAKNFKLWFMQHPMGIGRHTYKVLCLGDYTEKPQQAAELVWNMSGKKSASNGAVMRTSVVGLLKEDVEKHAADICRLTHADPRCVGASVIISALIHSLVYEERPLPLEKLIEIGRRYDERIEPYLKLAQTDTLKNLGLDDEASMGYTLKTMAAGVWCVYHATSFEEGLLAIVNEGGDADTNGAVAGSLLGAKYGYDAIPSQYIEGLKRKDMLWRIIRKKECFQK